MGVPEEAKLLREVRWVVARISDVSSFFSLSLSLSLSFFLSFCVMANGDGRRRHGDKSWCLL